MEAASHYEDGGHNGGGHMGGGNRRQMGGNVPFSKMVFDGKRMRKAIQRRTVDYNHSVARWMQVSKSISILIKHCQINKNTFLMLSFFFFLFLHVLFPLLCKY